MKWIFLLQIFGYIWMVKADHNFTFTYKMAQLCKEHICQHGYSYETYYKVDDFTHEKDPNLMFEMHIAIQASSNGHILLSPVPNPSASDSVYEIVVGGGGNKFTELRRNLRRNALSSVKTPGILSTVDLRAFYIKISQDGLVEFGKEGDDLPLISYYDVSPLQIKYFSFAAWNGVEAKFLYDCPAPGDTATPSSQEVDPKLSNSDDLKRTLLMGRLPYISPTSTLSVNLGIVVTNVRYDAFECKLVTRLAVVTSWTDDSMAWNPSKFNGTTRLKFPQGQIWRPKFYVLNSDTIDAFDTKNPDLISMVYSGEATFHFQAKINTWCYTDYNTKYSRWPHDEYNCSIIVQPWEAHEKIVMEKMNVDDIKLKMFADIDEVVENEWEVSYKSVIIRNSIWEMIYTVDDNQTHQSDRYMINVNLKRRATTYNIVLYTPLVVLVTFVLMSFWSEPLKMSRVWFYAGVTVFICAGLCYIDYFIPTHKIPSILVLYITVLIEVLIALVIHVLLINDFTETVCKTRFMQRILTSRMLRVLFCLPAMKTCNLYESINEAYATQEDDDSGVIVAPRNGNIEEMQSDNETYGDKKELAEVIDKLLFVVFSVSFAAMIAAHY